MMGTPSYGLKDGDSDGYSPSATLVRFDRPISLLRGPVPAGPSDEPDLGPYVLAFPTRESFFSALRSTKLKLVEQCEAGVRIGCSIAACNKCKPRWWKTLFGGPSKIDFRERSECEEREMGACLEGSKEKCVQFAEEKCGDPFGWARIACRERRLRMRENEVGRLISCVTGLGVSPPGYIGLGLVLGNQLAALSVSNLSYEVTNIRGSEIMASQLN